MTNCKHELHPEIVKRLKAGESDLGQCLKCREAIPLSAIEAVDSVEKKSEKDKKKNEPGSAV